jgi:hypothetical protein
MKIAIFGDSFAINGIKNPTASWVDLLSGVHDVTNFAQNGSSLYYSADQFLKNHHNFDKIIFMVTDTGRLYLPNHNVDRLIRHIPGLSNAEAQISDLKKYNPKDLDRLKILTAVQDYFLYVQNRYFDQYVHDLTINDILSKRADAILVPTTPRSKRFYKGKSFLVDVSLNELTGWSVTAKWTSLIDHRHAHLSAENNEILFKNVLKWLSGEPVSIDVDDYVQPTFLDFYLESRI